EAVARRSEAAPAGPDEGPRVGPRRPQPGRVLDGEDQPDDRRDPAGDREAEAFAPGHRHAPAEQHDAGNDHAQRPAGVGEIDADQALDEEEQPEPDEDDPEDDPPPALRHLVMPGARPQSRTGSASLCSTAHSAAWVRDASPSLPRMFETYGRAVRSVMKRADPMSLLLRPWPSSRTTSFSRSVSGSTGSPSPVFFARIRWASRRATAGSRWTSPAKAARTAVATSSASASLRTYPDAPASRAAVTFSSSMKLVIVTISVSGRSALIRPIAVTPSMFGMRRSISTTSGSRRRPIATPSLPSAASPTTSMSSWRSKNTRRPIRTTEWSSTMRTRMREEASSTWAPAGNDGRADCVARAGAVESSKGRVLVG